MHWVPTIVDPFWYVDFFCAIAPSNLPLMASHIYIQITIPCLNLLSRVNFACKNLYFFIVTALVRYKVLDKRITRCYPAVGWDLESGEGVDFYWQLYSRVMFRIYGPMC